MSQRAALAVDRAADVAARRLEELELRRGRRARAIAKRRGGEHEGRSQGASSAATLSRLGDEPARSPTLAPLGRAWNTREPAPRRDRRLRPGGLLRGRAPAEARRRRRVEVDMFDRLPTPFGLVRAGRRPRPPEDQVGDPRLREDRRPRGLSVLRQRRHRHRRHRRRARASATTRSISAYGTATDRRLGIPGEDLPGSHAATEFVNWYNAHPDFADHDFDLSVKRAVVIGNGNVAADVARMLALPRAELDVTDTADHAIERARRLGDRGDRRPRAPRARRRRRSPTPRCASSASSPTPTSSSTRPRWSSTPPAASTSSPRIATPPTAATSRSSPSSRPASPRASRSGS